MSSIKVIKDANGHEIGLEELKISIEDEMCKYFVELY